MLQDILKDFEELVDKLEIKVKDFCGDDVQEPINYLVTIIVPEVKKQIKQDYKHFITTTYNTARKELIEEILEELQKEMKGADWWIDYGDEIINLLNKKI